MVQSQVGELRSCKLCGMAKKKKKKKNTTKFNYTGSYIKDKVKKNYLGWEFSSSPVVRVLGLILGWGISHVM